MPWNAFVLIDLAATVAVASISFYVMEKPIIAWGRKLGSARRAEKESSNLGLGGYTPPVFRKSAQGVDNKRLTTDTF